MSKTNSIVAIFPSHTTAETAVKELQQSCFDMKKLRNPGSHCRNVQQLEPRGEALAGCRVTPYGVRADPRVTS